MSCRGSSLVFVLSSLVASGSGECHVGDKHCESPTDSTIMLQVSGSSISQNIDERSSQLMREGSISLAQHFTLLAKKLPDSSVTKSLFESFRVCTQCNHFERFGEANDGGYLTCMDGLRNGSVQAIYSLGVEQHDMWSEQVGKALSVPVNQFDCTVASSSCGECTFFKKCLVSVDGLHPVPQHEQEGWSLKRALEATAQSNAADGSLLMKMDIESSEWPIYASEPSETLRKFGEIIVEFHDLAFEDKHPEYLKAMKNILGSGFQIAHLHGNNWQGMYRFGNDMSIPNVLEVTFVAKTPTIQDGCVDHQVYRTLDAPNDPSRDELPMARLG